MSAPKLDPKALETLSTSVSNPLVSVVKKVPRELAELSGITAFTDLASKQAWLPDRTRQGAERIHNYLALAPADQQALRHAVQGSPLDNIASGPLGSTKIPAKLKQMNKLLDDAVRWKIDSFDLNRVNKIKQSAMQFAEKQRKNPDLYRKLTEQHRYRYYPDVPENHPIIPELLDQTSIAQQKSHPLIAHINSKPIVKSGKLTPKQAVEAELQLMQGRAEELSQTLDAITKTPGFTRNTSDVAYWNRVNADLSRVLAHISNLKTVDKYADNLFR